MMRSIGILAIALAVLCAVPATAEATPSFARKYRQNCTTCHAPFPKLNAFGEAFRLNGFVWPGVAGTDASMSETPDVPLGTPESREQWPAVVLPDALPAEVPISAWLRLSPVVGNETDTFGVPDVTLIVSGNLGEEYSYFMHLGQGTRISFTLNDFLHNGIFKGALDETPDDLLNVSLGIFEPGLMARSNVRRTTITELVFATGLRYEDEVTGNGSRFDFDRQTGLEFFGRVGERLQYTLGVVNGTRDTTDSNSTKDFYWRVGAKLGGMSFTGLRPEGEAVPEHPWQETSVAFGFFGYVGRQTVPNALVVGENYDIDFVRLGVDARVVFGNFDVMLTVMRSEDDNALATGVDVTQWFGSAQVDWMASPWLLVTARYEHSKFAGDAAAALRNQERRQIVGNLTMLLAANISLSFETFIAISGGGRDEGELYLFQLSVSV